MSKVKEVKIKRKRSNVCRNTRNPKNGLPTFPDEDDKKINENSIHNFNDQSSDGESVCYCNECNEPFSCLLSLQKHLESSHFPSNNHSSNDTLKSNNVQVELDNSMPLLNKNKDVNNKLKCPDCSRKFRNIFSLKTHRRKYHNAFSRQSIYCFSEDCKYSCSMLSQYISHLNDKHDMNINPELLGFSEEKQFTDWLLKIERETPCNFLKDKETINSEASKTSYYYCSRSGKYRTNRSEAKKRQTKTQGTCKIRDTCPAHFIKYVKMETGSITVRYVPTHLCFTNRFQQLGHIRLSKQDKKWVAEKLAKGVAVSNILSEARLSSGDNVKTDRRHLLTIQDIHNIARSHRIEFKKNKKLPNNTQPTARTLLDENQPTLDDLINGYLNPDTSVNSLTNQILIDSIILLYKRQNDHHFEIIPEQLALTSNCNLDDFIFAYVNKSLETEFIIDQSDIRNYIYIDSTQISISENRHNNIGTGSGKLKVNLTDIFTNIGFNDISPSINNVTTSELLNNNNINNNNTSNHHNNYDNNKIHCDNSNNNLNAININPNLNLIMARVRNSGVHIISLAVTNSENQFFPFAFMITNRINNSNDDNNNELFSLFLKSIKINLGSLKCTNLVTNSSVDQFYKRWTEVFNDQPKHLYCPVLLDQEWKDKVKKLIKDYKNIGYSVYQKLRKLMSSEEVITSFHAGLEELINELGRDEESALFLDYFQRNFQYNVGKWAKCYQQLLPSSGYPVNFNQIRHFFNSFLNLKKLTIDVIIWTILRSVHSYKYEHLVAVCKGKTKRPHPDIEHIHQESTTLDPTNILLTQTGNHWFVKSDISDIHFYEIEKSTEKCQCDLKCRHCQTCVHAYNCTCCVSNNENDVKRMCKHIHLLCSQNFHTDGRKLSQKFKNQSEMNAYLNNQVTNSNSGISQVQSSYVNTCQLLNELKNACNSCHSEEVLNFINKAIKSLVNVAKHCIQRNQIESHNFEKDQKEPSNLIRNQKEPFNKFKVSCNNLVNYGNTPTTNTDVQYFNIISNSNNINLKSGIGLESHNLLISHIPETNLNNNITNNNNNNNVISNYANISITSSNNTVNVPQFECIKPADMKDLPNPQSDLNLQISHFLEKNIFQNNSLPCFSNLLTYNSLNNINNKYSSQNLINQSNIMASAHDTNNNHANYNSIDNNVIDGKGSTTNYNKDDSKLNHLLPDQQSKLRIQLQNQLFEIQRGEEQNQQLQNQLPFLGNDQQFPKQTFNLQLDAQQPLTDSQQHQMLPQHSQQFQQQDTTFSTNDAATSCFSTSPQWILLCPSNTALPFVHLQNSINLTSATCDVINKNDDNVLK